MKRIMLLDEAEKYANMEYPKIGEPLQTEFLYLDGTRYVAYLPHIIDSESTGKFLPIPTLDEVECWEISRDKVIQFRRELANKRKYK